MFALSVNNITLILIVCIAIRVVPGSPLIFPVVQTALFISHTFQFDFTSTLHRVCVLKNAHECLQFMGISAKFPTSMAHVFNTLSCDSRKNSMVEMCKQSHWNLGANFISIDSEQMVMKVKAVDALLEPLAADGINGNQSKRDIQGKEEDPSV